MRRSMGKQRLSLGERLRRSRRERGINQTEIALVLGVSQPTISYWESDRKIPRHLRAVAAAYGIPFRELIQ
jgi:transcriptional regulator with XRE-family HTH domain